MPTRVTILLTLATLCCPACAVEDEEGAEPRMLPGTGSGSGGGTVFNTNVVDGEALSELLQPMGEEHHGVALVSVTLAGGRQVDHFEVEGGDIVAHDKLGGVAIGEQLIGSRWQFSGPYAEYAQPAVIKGRTLIEGVPHYRFMEGFETLMPSTCIAGADAIHARLLTGFTLDEASGEVEALHNNTYIACLSGATAKAAAWGYYDEVPVERDDFGPFEAAIRVVRADYCYDGVAHTHAGVPLLVEDVWEVRGPLDEVEAEAPLEALWGLDRLICAGTGRYEDIPGACAATGVKIPKCAEGATLADYPEAVFLTRLPGALSEALPGIVVP